MSLIKINIDQTVVYPYSITELKEDYPNTSFPSQINEEVLSQFSVYNVIEVPHSTNPYNIYTENTPIFIDGMWYQSWNETQMNEDEIEQVQSSKWEIIRYQRNQYLSECDWTQLPDSPLSPDKKQEWVVYRQELRDITTQLDPFNIIWPTKPIN